MSLKRGTGIWKKGRKPNLNPALTVTSFTVFCFVPIFIFSCLSFPVTRFIYQKKFQASECPDIYFLIYRSGFYYFTFPCIGQVGENIGIKLQKIEFQMDSQARWSNRGKRSSKPILLLWTVHVSMHLAENMHPQKIGIGTSDFLQTAHCPSKVGAFYGDTMS